MVNEANTTYVWNIENTQYTIFTQNGVKNSIAWYLTPFCKLLFQLGLVKKVFLLAQQHCADQFTRVENRIQVV